MNNDQRAPKQTIKTLEIKKQTLKDFVVRTGVRTASGTICQSGTPTINPSYWTCY